MSVATARRTVARLPANDEPVHPGDTLDDLTRRSRFDEREMGPLRQCYAVPVHVSAGCI